MRRRDGRDHVVTDDRTGDVVFRGRDLGDAEAMDRNTNPGRGSFFALFEAIKRSLVDFGYPEDAPYFTALDRALRGLPAEDVIGSFTESQLRDMDDDSEQFRNVRAEALRYVEWLHEPEARGK